MCTSYGVSHAIKALCIFPVVERLLCEGYTSVGILLGVILSIQRLYSPLYYGSQVSSSGCIRRAGMSHSFCAIGRKIRACFARAMV